MSDDHTSESAVSPIIQMNRRRFLRHSALGAAALITGCADDVDPQQVPPDMAQDMLAAPDLRADMGVDAGAAAEEMGQAFVPFSKDPFVQMLGDGRAHLRFETLTERPLEVRLERAGQSGMEFVATTNLTEIGYKWPPIDTSYDVLPDTEGLHNLQQVVFEGLEVGATYDWIVHQGDGMTRRGSFRAGTAPGQPFQLGWISDTMMPKGSEVAAALSTTSPDLIIHGGDLQYMTNPLDTWSGFFSAMRPLTKAAPMHTCVGNHELEAVQEIEEFWVYYSRLFEGHGEPGSTIDYAALTVGGVRFLLLNSETDLADPDSTQHQWMLAQLEEVATSNLRHAVVAFHRPYFTFSRSRPNFDTRDLLHPIFVQYGVPLVLTGHNHCYERFEVDGITYVMDGGGGALSYRPDHHREDVLAARPSDEALRVFSEKSYGATSARFNPDGTIAVTRIDATGATVETYTVG